tara:strand:- start:2245 stop:2487 length:243 start_codon:yes stop_codon:yes gene_type:complete
MALLPRRKGKRRAKKQIRKAKRVVKKTDKQLKLVNKEIARLKKLKSKKRKPPGKIISGLKRHFGKKKLSPQGRTNLKSKK